MNREELLARPDGTEWVEFDVRPATGHHTFCVAPRTSGYSECIAEDKVACGLQLQPDTPRQPVVAFLFGAVGSTIDVVGQQSVCEVVVL